MKTQLTILFAFFFSFSLISQANASADSDIDFIASANKPPIGVVFEIIEGNEKALGLALKKVSEYSEKLKKTIPNIKLAVVSHGTEQFALLNENKKRYKETHQKVQSLISNDVPVSVCETHASWYALSADDFPDYVDVAETGPKKVKEYQRKGYALVVIEL